MTEPLDLLALGLDDVLLVLQGLADPHLLLAQVPIVQALKAVAVQEVFGKLDHLGKLQ